MKIEITKIAEKYATLLKETRYNSNYKINEKILSYLDTLFKLIDKDFKIKIKRNSIKPMTNKQKEEFKKILIETYKVYPLFSILCLKLNKILEVYKKNDFNFFVKSYNLENIIYKKNKIQEFKENLFLDKKITLEEIKSKYLNEKPLVFSA